MIENMIIDLGYFSFDTTFIGTITSTAQDYNSDVYNNVVMNFMKNASFGVGASLLTLFMLMELVSIIQRGGGDNLSGIRIPANMMIKWAIVTFLFCNLNVVLDGIQEIAASLATNAAIANNGPEAVNTDVGAAVELIDSLGLIEKGIAYLVVALQWFIVNIFKDLVSLFLVLRMFELWIMIMFAPIPLSTLPSAEFRQTAINFIKSFTALCLSGVIIVAAFMLYSRFITSQFVGLDVSGGISEFFNSCLKNMCFLLALVITVFNSGRISKSLLNAM